MQSDSDLFAQVDRPDENLSSFRGARKIESFGGRRKQQQQPYQQQPYQQQQLRSDYNINIDQQQWNKIHDTFNNWNDDDGDDWNNSPDDIETNSDWTSDTNDEEDADHFANFQFEIKKLSEHYSGSEARPEFSRDTTDDADDERSESARRDDTMVNYNNYDTFSEARQKSPTFNNQKKFLWSKPEVSPASPGHKPTEKPKYSTKPENTVRMYRKPVKKIYPKSDTVLPAPTPFSDNRRINYNNDDAHRKYYQQQDYDQEAEFQFDEPSFGFKRGYEKNPIRKYFQQNDVWNTKESQEYQKYPYPYQKPVFKEPEFDYDFKPITTDLSGYQPYETSKYQFREVSKKKVVKPQTKPVSYRKSSSYLNLDEGTKVLSEPFTQKSNKRYKKPIVKKPVLNIDETVDDEEQSSETDLKTRSRGYRRIETDYPRRDQYQSLENNVVTRRVEDRYQRGSDDNVGGGSYSHPVNHGHHGGGLKAAVHAGADHYHAEHYNQPQRLSFQVHGQQGPKSYRFGHDTGVG